MESLRDLRGILEEAGRGGFPPADGTITVVPQHGPRDAGVLAFTAHSVVFTDEDPRWVYDTLAATPADPLAAAMSPHFLTAFAARTGRRTDTVDVMCVAAALPGGPVPGLAEIEDPGQPRVVSALGHRDTVRVWAAAEGGLLVLGRGVGGRLEAAVEVDEAVRHRGLGRRLATAARRLSGGEPVWAQISAGNARSLRAFLASGYRPVGSEALFLREPGQG
ncbi:GNAT family N-acetyltransferase [Streptomyces sp. NPDC088789]|uniref:GNAT family N-acetyltransferase n=1 Tax=Streptomyces sp. NPDC088789 TaxID=3365899 RepID=UPI0038093DF5